MSVRINTNVDALVAQQHLSQVGLDFSSAVAKLSSGLRINSAADDAAGLAISEKLTSQVNGFDQGSRNAQDAISMVQTGESALGTTHTILQRMRELAVQASNDSYTSSDRSNIQAEINQLIQEVDRISQQTDFNTKKLLDGSAGAAQVSGGGPDIKGIAVQGSVGFNGTYGTVSASGTGVGAATTFQAVRGSATASNTLLTKGSTMSVTAGNGTTYTFTVDNVNAKTMTVTGNTSGTGAGYSTTVTGNGAGGVVDVQDFMNAVNNITGGPLNAFQDAGNQVYVNDVIGGIQSTANTAGPAALNITAAGAANSFGLGLLNLNAAGGQGTVTRPDATSAANGFAIGTATVMSLTAAATRSSVESLSGPSGSYFTQTSSITIQGGLGNQTFTTQAGESLETLFQQVNGSGIGVTMAIDQTSGQVLIYNNNYGLKSAANLTGVNQVAVSNATGDFAGGVTPITGGLNMGFDSAFTAGSVDQNLKFLQNAGVDVAAVNAVVTFLDPGHIGSGVPQPATLGGGYTVITGQGQNSDIFSGQQGMAGTVVTLMNPGTSVTSNSWTVNENKALNFQVGANANQTVNLNVDAVTSQTLGVTSLDVLTTADAETAITQLDRAIQSVSTVRANMGAVINRLTNSMNNDSTASVNASAANSRIKDVDVAKETVGFTRDQILLQAGTAVLAQANQAPTAILSLLR